MANDPRDLDGSRLKQALLTLGRDPALRAELMQWLKRAEPHLHHSGSVRDDITGPIIDALHSEQDVYEKQLADGTRFRFLYRTKIARDFILADQERPSHVWEPQTTRLLQHLAAHCPGDVLIGGAYFGDHAAVLGVQLKGSGRLVHCFEPNSDQAAMLTTNAQLNALDNLRINELGLWHASSQRLRLDGFDSFANAVPAAGDEGFATITIDAYAEAQGRPIGVVMLDIEGAELNALQGAAGVLARDKPAVVFETHRDYVDWSAGLATTPICSLLSNAGYQLYAVRDFNTHQEMGTRCIELIPVDSVYLEGPPHGFNMLAIADATLITGNLFRQVKNVSPKLLRHKSPALHHPIEGMPE
ncbi:FkbM family methyltransferase [Hydrogenophaga defluvii]|uniref:FkbM family methyltransferase n=1 Tax=Hydrogenophaga defluvii TaxID=249410 RepID=A0ABW2SCA0_9BURK